MDLFKLQPSTEHPHGLTDRGFRFSVYDRQADHLQLPWLSVADSPARPTAAPITTTCTCADTRRRATSTRRWNWRSTTKLTASVWRSMSSTASRNCRRIGAHAKEKFRDRQIDCRNYAYKHGIDSPEISALEVAALARRALVWSLYVRARSSRRWYFIRLRLLALLPGHLCAANPRPRIGSWASGSA